MATNIENRLADKRPLYRNHSYSYTALRFMVDIYRAPKPQYVGEYKLYKTFRCYVIDTTYGIYRDDKRIMTIPVRIFIDIKSKDRNELKITMPNKYWRYRPKLVEQLKSYYLNINR